MSCLGSAADFCAVNCVAAVTASPMRRFTSAGKPTSASCSSRPRKRDRLFILIAVIITSVTIITMSGTWRAAHHMHRLTGPTWC